MQTAKRSNLFWKSCQQSIRDFMQTKYTVPNYAAHLQETSN